MTGPTDKDMARLYIQQARHFRLRGLHSSAVLFQRWAMVRRCRARTPAKPQGELFPEAA
jgi:hypothetical protein